MSPVVARRVRASTALLAATWLGGCAAFARRAPADAPLEEDPGEAVAAADTSAGAAATPPSETTPGPTPVTLPPAPIGPEQEVGVDLDVARRAELVAQATKDLEEAQRMIRAVPRDTAGPERLQKIETVESLIQAARAAFDTDVQAAAALAHKAQLLAAELEAS